MTYYGSKELAAAFRTVRANTIKIAEEVPEDQVQFPSGARDADGCQTLAHLAVSDLFPDPRPSKTRSRHEAAELQ